MALTLYSLFVFLLLYGGIYADISASRGQYSGWEDYKNAWDTDSSTVTYRSRMYPFGTKYMDTESGSLGMSPMSKKPFWLFGKAYSSIYISPHGHMALSNRRPTAPPTTFQPMVKFPNQLFPCKNKPAFTAWDCDPPMIAPYYAEFYIDASSHGKLLWRLLDVASDDAAQSDISKGLLQVLSVDVQRTIVGAEKFEATHGVLVTWYQTTWVMCWPENICPKNTIQAAIIADQNRTFAIYNYFDLQWVGGTRSNCTDETSKFCFPAQAGFNAGLAREFYELPGSNTLNIKSLDNITVTGVQGRFTYEIGGMNIVRGGCSDTFTHPNTWSLEVSPNHVGMLGGEPLIVSGPCFPAGTPVYCTFDSEEVQGYNIDETGMKAICPAPTFMKIGKVTTRVRVGSNSQSPLSQDIIVGILETTPPRIRLAENDTWFSRDGGVLTINWNPEDMIPLWETNSSKKKKVPTATLR